MSKHLIIHEFVVSQISVLLHTISIVPHSQIPIASTVTVIYVESISSSEGVVVAVKVVATSVAVTPAAVAIHVLVAIGRQQLAGLLRVGGLLQ